MPGWFDLESLEIDDYKEDVAGIEESIRYVETLVDDQISKGIPSDRIVVGGFSQGMSVILLPRRMQILRLSLSCTYTHLSFVFTSNTGGALSLSVILASKKKFAGCLCLSGYES